LNLIALADIVVRWSTKSVNTIQEDNVASSSPLGDIFDGIIDSICTMWWNCGIIKGNICFSCSIPFLAANSVIAGIGPNFRLVAEWWF